MLEFRRKMLIVILRTLDIGIAAFSLILAYVITENDLIVNCINELLRIKFGIYDIILFMMYLYALKSIYIIHDLYNSKRMFGFKREKRELILSISLSSLLLLFFGNFLSNYKITIEFASVFWICCVIITITSRVILRKIAIWIRLQNRNLRYLVIVGTNQRAVALYKRIIETPELGYKVKGFIDDDWKRINEFKRLNGI